MELFEQNWWGMAACLGMGPDLFMNGTHDTIPELDARGLVCKQCPVKKECLEYAIAIPWVVGIWGGTSAQEREQIRVRRKAHNGTNGASA